jgi:GNAT superfamily N-acetyltransferase
LCDQLGYCCTEFEVEGRLEDLTPRSDHILLVAVSASGKVVGWTHGVIRRLLIIPTHLELGGLVVDESQRGQGVGEKLISAIKAWAVDQGSTPFMSVRISLEKMPIGSMNFWGMNESKHR